MDGRAVYARRSVHAFPRGDSERNVKIGIWGDNDPVENIGDALAPFIGSKAFFYLTQSLNQFGARTLAVVMHDDTSVFHGVDKEALRYGRLILLKVRPNAIVVSRGGWCGQILQG